MGRTVTGGLVFTLVILMAAVTHAGPVVVIDGREIPFDVPPVIEHGRTMVPLRGVFEAVGAAVSWDSGSRTVTATRYGTEIRLTVGQPTAYRNDQAVSLDVPARIADGRTLVPLRFVSEALGCLTHWDGGSRTIHISSPADPLAYLARIMDQFHRSTAVYIDANSAGNSFCARGRLSSSGGQDAVAPMDEAWTAEPRSGLTCIRCSFSSRGSNWGGWYLMNGVLRGADTSPRDNWGTEPSAGMDLQGATKLTFWARGEQGGERVEFLALGVGRDPITGAPITPYPDSSPKVSTGYVTLTREWREYRIELAGLDLSCVLGGFGWVTSSRENGGRDIVFFLDDISYDRDRTGQPRLPVSYQVESSGRDFDTAMSNAAFTYDSALALLAFMAAGDPARARLAADALVYAQANDRFFADGRMRNAYQGGDLCLPPGWTPNGRADTVRMPGFAGQGGQWSEDRFQISTHTGNVAWPMLALLQYHRALGGDDSPYLQSAVKMAYWVEQHCRDERGAGGYVGGFDGWEPAPTKLMYKATEHNIDLYAAFRLLHRLTGEEKWREPAEHARRFVLAMWDEEEGKFWTGTTGDGVTINRDVIPLDVQAWAVLALGEEGRPYWRALDYVERNHRVGQGYDFDEDGDGIWYEGTAQMALAYHFTGNESRWRELCSFLRAALEEGGLPASDTDGLTTGFDWEYFRRLHVGATAWLVLCERGVNPF